MYKLVVYAVLLYGVGIWLVTDAMMTVLDVLHNRIVRRISVMRAKKFDGRE